MGRRIFHPMKTELDIGVGGMTCASCVARVERGLQKVPGVQTVAVNLATESARIAFDDADLTEARLRRAIRDAGYEPRAADAAVDQSPPLLAGDIRRTPHQTLQHHQEIPLPEHRRADGQGQGIPRH